MSGRKSPEARVRWAGRDWGSTLVMTPPDPCEWSRGGYKSTFTVAGVERVYGDECDVVLPASRNRSQHPPQVALSARLGHELILTWNDGLDPREQASDAIHESCRRSERPVRSRSVQPIVELVRWLRLEERGSQVDEINVCVRAKVMEDLIKPGLSRTGRLRRWQILGVDRGLVGGDDEQEAGTAAASPVAPLAERSSDGSRGLVPRMVPLHGSTGLRCPDAVHLLRRATRRVREATLLRRRYAESEIEQVARGGRSSLGSEAEMVLDVVLDALAEPSPGDRP